VKKNKFLNTVSYLLRLGFIANELSQTEVDYSSGNFYVILILEKNQNYFSRQECITITIDICCTMFSGFCPAENKKIFAATKTFNLQNQHDDFNTCYL